MRKLKIILGIVGIAFVLLLLAVWLFVDVNKFQPQIQAKLEQQLHRNVTLGKMSLGLLPVRFTVKDVVIAEDPTFKSSFPFTQARQLDVRVRLLSLLSGNVQVASIDLQEPSVELIRDKKGVWNFASLSPSSEGAPPEPGAPTPTPPTSGQPVPSAPPQAAPATRFSLNRLSIRGGKIAVTDLLENQPRTVYEPIDVTLRDYSDGQPFSFEVTAHIPGSGSQSIRIKGTGGPLPPTGPAAMPLDATVDLNNIDIAGLRKFLESDVTSKAVGTLSGQTQIQSKSGKLSAKGKLNLTGARAGDVEIGYPIGMEYDLSSDVATGILQISNATLKLGETPLTVTGTVNTNPTPMELDLRLKTADVSIEEVARLASAFGIAFSPDTTVAGKITGDVRARGPVSALALNGNVSGRDLKISGKNVPQPVEVKELSLTLTPAEIQSNEFQATTGKTTVTGRLAVRQYTSEKPAIDLALRAPGATLPEIQAISRAYGMKGLDQLSGPGALSFDLRATGPLDSMASNNVMRALNGKIDLNFDTMKIQGVDASKELARIGGFLKSDSSNKGFTEVLKLTGNILVKNGIASTNDLEARLSEGTLAVAGTSNLADQSLDLRATALFSKAVSDKAGGTGIGGYLKTALSNDKGELVIPVIIAGTFQKPAFAPDTQALLKMQRARLLPGLDNPRGALSNVLDGLTGKKKTEEEKKAEEEKAAQPAQEQPKPNTLKGVFEGIFGGKK
jgi:AsmA protein